MSSEIGELERRSHCEPELQGPKKAWYTQQLSLLSGVCPVEVSNGPEAALHKNPHQSRGWMSKGCRLRSGLYGDRGYHCGTLPQVAESNGNKCSS